MCRSDLDFIAFLEKAYDRVNRDENVLLGGGGGGKLLSGITSMYVDSSTCVLSKRG